MRLCGLAIFATLFVHLFATPLAGAPPSHGAPVADPAGIIDLPPGFNYKIVARTGDRMSDGLVVPALPDGMGAFKGPDGTTIVVCNHECKYPWHGAFGADGAGLSRIDTTRVYDRGDGRVPAAGGTTTFVWNTRTQTLVRHYLSLAGTLFNCSGTTTPWDTWLTCEERTYRTGSREGGQIRLQRDHGYVFEVPARAEGGLVDPVPLTALGRFTHESLLYDGRTGVLYQTEDLLDGLFYRFIARERGQLRSGGSLQALALDGVHEANNRVPGARVVKVGDSFAARWIQLDDVAAPGDDLRRRGYDLGACRFDRGEGMCIIGGVVYFASTMGGVLEAGQIWRYLPSKWEGTDREGSSPGRAELFYEVNDPSALRNPDNLAATATGDLLVCEDPEDMSLARLVIVTRERDAYTFAAARMPGELSGAVFSPDGSTLFVNMQKAGITLAVTGPWKKK
jgi:secreted PhoX family phosphatase